jgi:hypothetical protein
MTTGKPPQNSTTQVDTPRFTPHGKVDIWMGGNLHHYEASGPFNRELVDCLAIAQASFLQASKPAAPWVSICTVIGSALATTDGMQRYAELIRSAPPELTPVATAYVIGPDVEGGQFMAPRFARIFADAHRPFQTFPTMAEARQWALAMIEKANGA